MNFYNQIETVRVQSGEGRTRSSKVSSGNDEGECMPLSPSPVPAMDCSEEKGNDN